MPPPDEDDPYAEFEAPAADPYAEFDAPPDEDSMAPREGQIRIGGTSQMPREHRETGRVARVHELPGFDFSVDPSGENAPTERQIGTSRTTEIREVEPDPAVLDRQRREAMEAQIALERRGLAEGQTRNAERGGNRTVPWQRVGNMSGGELGFSLGGRDMLNERALRQAGRSVLDAFGDVMSGDAALDYWRGPTTPGQIGNPNARRRISPSSILEQAFPVTQTDEPIVGSDLRSQSGIIGATDAATLGYFDELASVAHGDTAEEQRAIRDRHRRVSRRAEEQAPGTYAIGQMAGTIPQLAAPVGGQTALARMGSTTALGLGTGALRGAGESEAEDLEGILRDSSREAISEGLLSGGLQGAGEVTAPALRALQRALPRAADHVADAGARARMQASGLNPTPAPRTRYGRHVERLGGAEEVARMLDEEQVGGRLLPTASDVPDSVARIRGEAGDDFERIASSMEAAGDAGTIPTQRYVEGIEQSAQELESLRTGQARRAARRSRREYIDPQIAPREPDTIGPPGLEVPRMPFRQAQRLRTQLGDESGMFARAADPARASQAGLAGEARDNLSRLMNEAAENVDPALRQDWRSANRRWSLGELLNENARPGGGLLGPTIAESSALAMGEPLQAVVGRAAQGMAQRYGPALRARSLQVLAPRLRNMGPRFAAMAQRLESAMQRGQTALSAAHFAMLRTDPEYRSAVEAMQTEEEQE